MIDHERDVRDALRARSSAVPVGPADEPGLGRRLIAARRRRQAKLAGAAVAVLVMFGATSLLAANDDQDANVVTGPGPSSTTALEPATTTVQTGSVETTAPPPTPVPTAVPPTTAGPVPTTAPTATASTAPLPPVPDDAIWPPPGSTTTFSTPDQAAADFSRRFLGMGTPQLGPGRVAGGGADATVDIRPLPNGGPTTTVAMRRIDRRGWVVVGCSADKIQVDQPAVGAAIASPLSVRGRAWVFEGTVDVEVRDGGTAPIGRSFGTGGGSEMLPFEATVTFSKPGSGRGTVVVSEARADDGTQGPAAATVVRVRF